MAMIELGNVEVVFRAVVFADGAVPAASVNQSAEHTTRLLKKSQIAGMRKVLGAWYD